MNRLKELRKEQGITLDDVEEKLGIKRSTFNRYENGESEPKLKTWIKLAEYFKVPVDYLQGLSDDRGTDVKELASFMNRLLSDPEDREKTILDLYDWIPVFDPTDLSVNIHELYSKMWMSLEFVLGREKASTMYEKMIEKQPIWLQEHLIEIKMSEDEILAKRNEMTDQATEHFRKDETFKEWIRSLTNVYEIEKAEGRLEEFNGMINAISAVSSGLSVNNPLMIEQSKKLFSDSVDNAFEYKRIPVHGANGITYVQSVDELQSNKKKDPTN